MKDRTAWLALADGTVFEGLAFGAEGTAEGEVVFNTSMTGYQEILTDPSYHGQIVTMTYPLIGNYGVNAADIESRHPRVKGFIVKEPSRIASNRRSEQGLEDYMRQFGIVGIHGIDTRALTRRIRLHGAQAGVLATGNGARPSDLVERAREIPSLEGMDLAREVTCSEPYAWAEEAAVGRDRPQVEPLEAVVYDFGVKRNILRLLVENGFRPWVVPAQTPAEEVLARHPDAIVLSNGPGDPAAVGYGVRAAESLVGKKPIMGICLGHQILGLALGARTYKLKFGHHGGNHPVKDLDTGRVEITAQNHGFALEESGFGRGKCREMQITHRNLYDGTVEGFLRRGLPILSVQYHPEASPGPHDADYLFARFRRMVEG